MASLIQVVSPKRRRACFPPLLEPQYYDLDPSLAQTLKPKMSSANISKAKNFLRSNVEVVLANPEMSIADHCSVQADPFDVGVHIDSVKCGLRFPLHPFMSEFFNAHKIIPAQLAPNGYRFLVVLLNVCEECHIPPSLTLFHYLLSVEPGTATENKGFVTISSRHGFKFLTDFPSNQMGWKKKFFKVRVPPSQISFHNVWATRILCYPTPTETPELKSYAEKITMVSRSCKVYGSQEKIDILYGFTALPIVPLPLIDDPLILIHQAPMAIKEVRGLCASFNLQPSTFLDCRGGVATSCELLPSTFFNCNGDTWFSFIDGVSYSSSHFLQNHSKLDNHHRNLDAAVANHEAALWEFRSRVSSFLNQIGCSSISHFNQARLSTSIIHLSLAIISPFLRRRMGFWIWPIAVDAAHHTVPARAVDCNSVILNLADCLTFFIDGSTEAKPLGSCCSGLKMVMKTNTECLCKGFKKSLSINA
nr:non-specific lipid-transfer protein-like protein At2g13820 [Ipomoea batatas]